MAFRAGKSFCGCCRLLLDLRILSWQQIANRVTRWTWMDGKSYGTRTRYRNHTYWYDVCNLKFLNASVRVRCRTVRFERRRNGVRPYKIRIGCASGSRAGRRQRGAAGGGPSGGWRPPLLLPIYRAGHADAPPSHCSTGPTPPLNWRSRSTRWLRELPPRGARSPTTGAVCGP